MARAQAQETFRRRAHEFGVLDDNGNFSAHGGSERDDGGAGPRGGAGLRRDGRPRVGDAKVVTRLHEERDVRRAGIGDFKLETQAVGGDGDARE